MDALDAAESPKSELIEDMSPALRRGDSRMFNESEGNMGQTLFQLRQERERLDSWKEIAAYLNRNVRTVQRWEKYEGLPIHRHMHQRASSIAAYKKEIDSWLRQRSRVPGDCRMPGITRPAPTRHFDVAFFWP